VGCAPPLCPTSPWVVLHLDACRPWGRRDKRETLGTLQGLIFLPRERLGALVNDVAFMREAYLFASGQVSPPPIGLYTN
jgi:hypothetical protein